MTAVDRATGEVVQHTPFSQFLMEHRQAGLHGELTDRLAEVVAAVTEHGKQGSLTVSIQIKPAHENVIGGQLIVTDDVKVKIPEPPRGASLFYADDDGNLSRRDPRQPELPLREIPKTETNVREVPGA